MEWRWDSAGLVPGYEDPMMMPTVGDVDEDGVPEVVFVAYADRAYTSAGALWILDGETGAEEGAWTDIGGHAPYGSAGVALGDLDGDGTPEILTVTTDSRVLAVHADGSLVWASEARPDDLVGYTPPHVADLDGDGLAEVIAGRAVFDHSGATVGVGTGGLGGRAAIAVVADLDVDGVQEVVSGNSVHARDGTMAWHRDDLEDGFPAVGDLDGDGQGEVVSVGSGTVTLLDGDGSTLWGPVAIPGGGGGPPTVADFDGDGAGEIGVAGATYYSVFDTDGSVLWSQPTQDASSQRTGSSVFDFEGDGRSEVVYADELTLWVYDGATGEVRLEWTEHASWTLFEYPVIADVDADGASEIVLMSNDGLYDGWQGITVIGDLTGTWAPTAPTWNQHGYHVTNIEDDLSVPASPPMPWETGHDSFRAGGLRDRPGIPAPDLIAAIPDACFDCAAGTVEVALAVGNQGTADVDGTVVAAVWARTADGTERLLGTETWPLGVGAGTRTAAVSVSGDIGDLDVVELVARVDHPDAWAAAGLSGDVEECAEDNGTVLWEGGCP